MYGFTLRSALFCFEFLDVLPFAASDQTSWPERLSERVGRAVEKCSTPQPTHETEAAFLQLPSSQKHHDLRTKEFRTHAISKHKLRKPLEYKFKQVFTADHDHEDKHHDVYEYHDHEDKQHDVYESTAASKIQCGNHTAYSKHGGTGFFKCISSNSAGQGYLHALARNSSLNGEFLTQYGRQLCACCKLTCPTEACREYVEANFFGSSTGDVSCDADGLFTASGTDSLPSFTPGLFTTASPPSTSKGTPDQSINQKTNLLSIKTDADLTRRNDGKAVQIYYSNGFFGSMKRRDFSQQCGFPCVRASFPNDHAAQTADALMVFPMTPVPPKNQRGAVVLGHTEEAIALYGGQNAHNYEAMADMNWRSTVPWTYFDPINIRKNHSHQVLNSAPWEARKPAAVFVARNCGSHDRNSLISQLIAHGVEVDSISSCKPGGSHGSWPAGVPYSDKVGALQKYRVYLALENRKEKGYVTEKVADGLMSGATTVYLGAPDIDNYVPDTALINANNYSQDIERIVSQIKRAINDKSTWESHRSWLKQSPEQWNQSKILKAFSYSDGKPPECRLCRYAYSKRMGLGWDWGKQQPANGSIPRNGDKFWKTWPSVKHA